MGDHNYTNEVRSLLECNYPGLSRLLARKLGDPDLAADMLNQAIIHSLQQHSENRLSDPQRIAGYVYRTALNLLRNHRRNHDNRPDLQATAEELETLAKDGETPEEQVTATMTQQVRRLVNELSTERDRVLLKRFYLDEEEKADICRDLKLNPLHFDKIIFRARQRMRQLMEEKGFRRTDFFSILMVCFA